MRFGDSFIIQFETRDKGTISDTNGTSGKGIIRLKSSFLDLDSGKALPPVSSQKHVTNVKASLATNSRFTVSRLGRK